MKKEISIIVTILLSLSGCVSTPDTAEFNGQNVGTFSAASGCGDLSLDEDCSAMSGATRSIEIGGIELRAAGGQDGTIVLIMSKPKMKPDETAIEIGGQQIEKYLKSKGIEVLETKVMYSNNLLFGVHYTLSGDGYSYIKELSVE